MRVGVYYNNNDVRVEELPVPEIGEGELLVKVVASGICGSDVMEWYRVKKAPLVLGHEITGEIVKAGKGVERYKVGDRVFVSHHVPCNTCHYCRQGQHTACETLHTTNFYPGGFAEYLRVPAINVERGVFILPPEISFTEGTFIEPLACVLRAQRAAQLRAGQSVLILGSGISGLLHLLCARVVGCRPIVMSDINPFRLQLARELGADKVMDAKGDVVAGLRKANEERLADLVIVCAGVPTVFEQALEAVGRGGTILFFAPTEPGVKVAIPVNEFWRNNIKIIHSYGSSPDDTKEAIELMRRKRPALEKMITHKLGLEDIGKGFRLMSEGKDSLKIIIQPHQP